MSSAADSAIATDLLANDYSKVLTILDSGEQARIYLEAMLTVRAITQVNIWSSNIDEAKTFQQEMSQSFDGTITVHETIKDAVKNADIICSLTSSNVPVLFADWVKPGVHINAVGASKPSDRELDIALVQRSRLFVDSMELVMNGSADYLIALNEGAIGKFHIIGEMGELLQEAIPGRCTSDSITVFKTLGLSD